MSRVAASPAISEVKPDDLSRFTEICLVDIVARINGDLDFATNINCKLISVSFPAASTSVSIAHSLGRVVAGYIVTSLNANMVIFNGTGANSSSALSLQSSAAGTAGLLIF